jgi:hypothetical protein
MENYPFVAIRAMPGVIARNYSGGELHEVIKKARHVAEMHGLRTCAVMSTKYRVWIEPGDVIPMRADGKEET